MPSRAVAASQIDLLSSTDTVVQSERLIELDSRENISLSYVTTLQRLSAHEEVPQFGRRTRAKHHERNLDFDRIKSTRCYRQGETQECIRPQEREATRRRAESQEVVEKVLQRFEESNGGQAILPSLH